MARKLRSGYTTGACAAAAAKAAVQYLGSGKPPAVVEIPFPDGCRVEFQVQRSERISADICRASIIKDAGDDPDVTNGAEIVAQVEIDPAADAKSCLNADAILIKGGEGVGRVTKPGLAVQVNEPAINPVPRKMIRMAVAEALDKEQNIGKVTVTISVPLGEKLAEKTLNRRLGIIGGLSILGTTGIVRPVSAEAWTETIKASLSVAREAGLREVVLSTGRTSEKGVARLLDLPEEAYAMMGDFFLFSLQESAAKGFEKIHLAGMWAKIMKAALRIPHTHVRYGPLRMGDCLNLLEQLGAGEDVLATLADVNTAREIYQRLAVMEQDDLVRRVCCRAKAYAEDISGLPVRIYLVASGGKVVMHV